MYFEIKEKPIGSTSGTPLINETIIPYNTGIFAQRKFNVKLLVEWIDKTPEAIGILRAIANDIVTKISFRAVDKKRTGRPTSKSSERDIEKAEEFAAQNRLKQLQIATIIDWIKTGDFYVWLGIVSDEQKSELGNEITKELSEKYGVQPEYKVRYLDEDYTNIRKIRYAPSETVEIDYTETEVLGFIQSTYATFRYSPTVPSPNYLPTGFQKRYWKPNQIIHGKFMEMNGKVYGFTPLYSDSAVIRTLGLIKDFAGTFFENGGFPEYMFMFESAGFTNKQNIDELKEELQKYKNSANKHGNFVGEATGRFQAIKLNDFNKDMEFRQLMIMYSGVIAFSLGFPSSRLKAIIGADIKSSTGETDAETDAYQRNVENMQDYILNLWNTQLWIPFFGVKQSFSRGYRQDEVREVQRDVQKIAYLQSVDPTLKIELTDDYVKEYLNLDDKSVKEIKHEEPDMMAQKGILPNNQVLKGQASQAHQNEKRAQAPKDKNKQTGS